MTSNSLSINLKRYFTRTLQSYWWLMLICGIIYFFSGPVVLMMGLQSITRYETVDLLVERMDAVQSFFAFGGFYAYYIIAIVLAALIGIVMFAYLQHKRQINFYHSQPIKRTKLFVNFYATGLLVNFIPLVLMTMVMLLVALLHGCGGAIAMGPVLLHLGRMMLFAAASYSIAILAGQLTGTVLTQICMTGVLHFGIPIFGAAIDFLSNAFFKTASGNLTLAEKLSDFSPIIAVIRYFDQQDMYRYGATEWNPYGNIQGLELSMLLILLAIVLLGGAAAWLLYQKRPGEATGQALIYKRSEPFFILYLMFIAAIGGGLLFQALGNGNEWYFLFGLLTFGIMVHMACQVIIQKDFKAMLGNWKRCAAMLVVLLAIVGVVKFDLIGYDSYLPAADKVAEIRMNLADVDGLYGYYYYGEDGEKTGYTDTQDIANILEMLGTVIYAKAYDIDLDQYGGYDKTSNITVSYILKDGRTVDRRYYVTPPEGMEEAFAVMYERPSFKEVRYKEVLQIKPEQLERIVVNGQEFSARGQSYYGDVYVDSSLYQETLDVLQEDSVALLTAYQQDLRQRTMAILQEPCILELNIDWELPESTYRYNNYRNVNVKVFPGETNTLAVLKDLESKYPGWKLYTAADRSMLYESLEVYRSQEHVNRYLEDYLYNDAEAFQNSAEHLATITDPGEIAALQSRIFSVSQLYGSGTFLSMDETYFIVAISKTKDQDMAQWTEREKEKYGTDGDGKALFFFKGGQVPVQYQQ